MNRLHIIRRLVAVILFFAVASIPFGGTIAMADGGRGGELMAGMSMTGMSEAAMADDMDCCPPEKPNPAATCDKAACPTMATCLQQCIPASTAEEGWIAALSATDVPAHPMPSDILPSSGRNRLRDLPRPDRPDDALASFERCGAIRADADV